MSTVLKWRMAEQFYNAGYSLFQEGRYEQALEELSRAEEAFRRLDARGHPWGHSLPNGVSGLANTFALQGQCHQKLGDYRKAVISYESSLINTAFEQKRPFHSFMAAVSKNMALCYEKELSPAASNPDSLPPRGLEIDMSFRFPFSLRPELIPAARLYELEPGLHRNLKGFYERAKKEDADFRHRNKRSEDAAMKRMSIFVWGLLLTIWIVYGLVVAEAMLVR
jgi:tetratricopeptide (TPR) repeat protein